MSTTNSTTPVTSLNGVPLTNVANPNGQKTGLDKTALGKDDFLKLLVGQLQHQDPMQPSDDTQFIGQMAQFSQLEQETNTAQSTNNMATQLGRAGALGLIGRTVSYTDANGASQSGVVSQVNVADDGTASLTVAGTSGIDAGSVTQVR
jgi:flagellar basal-body rod modification protein FlgD